MELGEIIIKYRREKGLTLRSFADKAGCSYEYIRLLELGRRKRVNYEILIGIANALEISLQDLIRTLNTTVRKDDTNEKDIEKSDDSAHRDRPSSIRCRENEHISDEDNRR